jgi:hypothetical protein
MPAPVVVEVTAASPDASSLTAMLEACSRAVGDAPCMLARQAPEPPYEAVAIVTLMDDGTIRVEVGVQASEPRSWHVRELVFKDSDLEIERWRAVGFVLGTLATAARAEPALSPEGSAEAESAPVEGTPNEPPKPAEPARAPPPPRVDERPMVRRAWIGVGGFMGDGLNGVLARSGPYGRLALRPFSLPLYLGASIAYGASSEQGILAARWLDFGLGLGVVALESEALCLDVTLEGVAERFSAEVRDPVLGVGGEGRFVGLGRGRVELGWFWSDYVGASTFFEGAVRGGKTKVLLRGAEVGKTERFGYTFGLGLSFRFVR